MAIPTETSSLSSTQHLPPSVSEHLEALQNGQSYTHYTALPPSITPNTPNQPGTPCVLGIDEAGRGPVIGPMVYSLFYLPTPNHIPLLTTTHSFNDSKVLTPQFRSHLMTQICTPTTDLHSTCGWAIKSLSARSISADMLAPITPYNLNAQAMDATVELIRGVMERGINVEHIYIDTIGQPVVYQRKLERIFPTVKITVEKKADSLFPVVSAASVVAKVTRDISCEVLEEGIRREKLARAREDDCVVVDGEGNVLEEAGWGSGYPSDARCVAWMKGSMDGVFGWGSECRFSWGTVKDLMEGPASKGSVAQVEWPDERANAGNAVLSQYFVGGGAGVGGTSETKGEADEFRNWYGKGVKEIF